MIKRQIYTLLLLCLSIYTSSSPFDGFFLGHSAPRAPGRNVPHSTAPEAPYGPPATIRSCETDRYMSQRMLRGIMDNPNQLRVEFVDERKTQIKIVFPAYYSACLDEPEIEHQIVNNNFHFRVKMSKTYNEYIQCLKNDGYIDDEGRVKNADLIKGTLKNQKILIYDLENFDRKKNMSVFFESPIPNSNNGSHHPYFNGNIVSESDCYQNENIIAGETPLVLYTSPENLAARSARAACETQDYERILGELQNLDQSSVGNAEDLRRVLEENLRIARDKTAQEIYAQLESINNRFAPGEDGELGVSEGQAGRLATEYRRLVRELDQVLLDPSKEKLLELIERREAALDPDHQDYLEEQIERINISVGEYDKTNHFHFYKGLQKYGLTEKAREIEKIRLKSKAYSRIYVGRRGRRGRKFSGEDAERFIEGKLRKFDRVLSEWELSYRAGSGDASAIRQQERITQRITRRIGRESRGFQRSEVNMMNRYCGRSLIGGVRNPAGCRRFMANRQRREHRFTRRRDYNIQQANLEDRRLQHYRELYERGRERTLNDWIGNDDSYGFYDYDDVSNGSGNSFYDFRIPGRIGGPHPWDSLSFPNAPMMRPMQHQF